MKPGGRVQLARARRGGGPLGRLPKPPIGRVPAGPPKAPEFSPNYPANDRLWERPPCKGRRHATVRPRRRHEDARRCTATPALLPSRYEFHWSILRRVPIRSRLLATLTRWVGR
ncbi:hypothetical protein HPB50_019735 [Hyalomma asiaticum]|uniref:Uncharacterized protein n=1 Tax=Hyalomma asiaticum TaxID=266040 RepID=A0ACB7TMI7_HYAAI|nr:hypothetical protein HPB50_019735 [Hyalomma asiaticum]